MVKQIAQSLFDWINEAGPVDGDAFSQVRLDGVADFLNGAAPSPVPLTDEELGFTSGHRAEIDDEIQRLIFQR